MVFPYWEELRGDEIRLLPLVPVTLRHDQTALDAYALVDSGAEHNVFPLAAAEELEYDLSDQRDVTVVGAGGKHTPGKLARLDFQLAHYQWAGPAIFSSAVNERPVLGQAGFFAFFTVTFRHRQRDIEIVQS